MSADLSFELVRFAVIDAIAGSVIEKTDHSWTYRQGTLIRAQVGMENGKLHGPFRVYYPNGQVWIEGSYSRDRRNDDWVIYFPDGKRYTNVSAA